MSKGCRMTRPRGRTLGWCCSKRDLEEVPIGYGKTVLLCGACARRARKQGLTSKTQAPYAKST